MVFVQVPELAFLGLRGEIISRHCDLGIKLKLMTAMEVWDIGFCDLSGGALLWNTSITMRPENITERH